PQRIGGAIEQRLVVGQTRLHDGFLDMAIRPLDQSPVVIVMLELVPMVGVAESPAFRVEPKKPYTASLKFTDTAESAENISYFVRTATSDADGSYGWSGWTPLDPEAASFQVHDLFQLQAVLQPGPTHPPVLRNM